jgi:hypothetical protein
LFESETLEASGARVGGFLGGLIGVLGTAPWVFLDWQAKMEVIPWVFFGTYVLLALLGGVLGAGVGSLVGLVVGSLISLYHRRHGAHLRPLIQALRDDDWQVRVSAAWSLGKVGGRPAVEPLSRALQDENLNVRAWAAWSLGQLADPLAVGPLKEALKDPEEWVRQRAATALYRIDTPEARAALAAYQRSPYPAPSTSPKVPPADR